MYDKHNVFLCETCVLLTAFCIVNRYRIVLCTLWKQRNSTYW